MIELLISEQAWDLNKSFNISRGAKLTANTVHVHLIKDGEKGIGECVPYTRYNETIESVKDQINELKIDIESEKINLNNLSKFIKPGAARNAIDCAFWDLKCRIEKKNIWRLLGEEMPDSIQSCYTIVLDTPNKMIDDAKEHSNFPMLKVKLDHNNLEECLRGIRKVSKDSTLILDANESFNFKTLDSNMDLFLETNVDLIEQPLAADQDDDLLNYKSPIPICADESFHSLEDFERIANKYDSINIKLDKTGGLSEAIEIKKYAHENNKIIMIGCMVSSSLSMMPAITLCNDVKFVDLDGPCFLKSDVKNGLSYKNGVISFKEDGCWG